MLRPDPLLSPRDYIQHLLDKVSQLDPDLKSFIPETNRAERVFHSIRQLEKAYPEAADKPPLYGVPVGIKDIFLVDQFHTKAGSKLPPDLFEGPEALCVTQLKNAGAIVFGKTATTEFAYLSPGPTCNPHNHHHTPGGSSSGSAAAVASGFVPVALGTQTIGSIIRPASYCGIIGFKPSFGRISTEGVLPLAPSFDHVGFFVNHLEDINLVASVLCDSWDIHAEIPDTLRIGIPHANFLQQSDPLMLRYFQSFKNSLNRDRIECIELNLFENVQQINHTHLIIMSSEAATVHQEWFNKYEHLYSRLMREFLQQGFQVTQKEFDLARQRHQENIQEYKEVLEHHDVHCVISPAAQYAAPQGLNSTGSPWLNLPFTHVGAPTVTLPFALSDNQLPLGLQISGRIFNDEMFIKQAGSLGERIPRPLQMPPASEAPPQTHMSS